MLPSVNNDKELLTPSDDGFISLPNKYGLNVVNAVILCVLRSESMGVGLRNLATKLVASLGRIARVHDLPRHAIFIRWKG